MNQQFPHEIYNPMNNGMPQYSSGQPNIYDPSNAYGNMDSYNNKSHINADGIDDDIPLLEELEIDIVQITILVLVPFKHTEIDLVNDADLGGPILYCLAYGFLLVLSGKFSGFGVIYGISVVGSLLLFCLVNLMSMQSLPFYSVTSIFGYSLIPMIFLAIISLVFKLTSVNGIMLAIFMILWASVSSTSLITKAMHETDKFFLICYPSFMLYATFAIVTLFNY